MVEVCAQDDSDLAVGVDGNVAVACPSQRVGQRIGVRVDCLHRKTGRRGGGAILRHRAADLDWGEARCTVGRRARAVR